MQGLTRVGSQLCNTLVGSESLLLNACKAFPSELVEKAGERRREKEREKKREKGDIFEMGKKRKTGKEEEEVSFGVKKTEAKQRGRKKRG